jgi:hypothetical protein
VLIKHLHARSNPPQTVTLIYSSDRQPTLALPGTEGQAGGLSLRRAVLDELLEFLQFFA